MDKKSAKYPELAYKGSLTAEQFLFYEIRIVSRFYLDGKDMEEIVRLVGKDNLFQYPTERQVSRMVRACVKRLDALDDHELVCELAQAPVDIAKQINLYAMMRYNRLVWDFMVQVIGEKFKDQDFFFSRRDMSAFFSRLQSQNDAVAAWSDTTVKKIMSVFARILSETGYLENSRAEVLNPVFLCEELEKGIRRNGDLEALAAFNCFR